MMVSNGIPTEQVFRADKPPITKNYIPAIYASNWSYFTRVPPFTLLQVGNMLADFRIRWGLWMIKGPILCKSRFFIKTDNPQVKEFLINQVTRYWRTSAIRVLKAIEWGFSNAEVLYKTEDGQIQFDYLKDLHSVDCFALTSKRTGQLAASRIKRVPKDPEPGTADQDHSLVLVGPRKLWHIHNREFHPHYGQSRLYGSYFPWLEIWGDGGYRDSRRLYFHKYAYDGGGMYVPDGTTNLGNDGSGNMIVKANMELGRDIVEKKKSGGVVILPGTTDDKGMRTWELIPPSVLAPPDNIMDYGEVLKNEEWEGMGIPPEIAQAEGTGAYAGRVVPLMGFYTILQEIVYWMIHDADEQCFRPLVDFNFGPGIQYEIIPFSLLDEANREMNEADGGGGNDQMLPNESPGGQLPNQPDPQQVMMSLLDGSDPRHGSPRKREVINRLGLALTPSFNPISRITTGLFNTQQVCF